MRHSDVAFTAIFGIELLLKVVAFTGVAYIQALTNQARARGLGLQACRAGGAPLLPRA